MSLELNALSGLAWPVGFSTKILYSNCPFGPSTWYMVFLSVIVFGSTTALSRGRGRSRDQGAYLNYGMAGCGFGVNNMPYDTVSGQLGVTFTRDWVPFTVVLSGVYVAFSGLAASNGNLFLLGIAIGTGGFALSWSFPFAMTSGTSNCVPHNQQLLAQLEQKVYILANLNQFNKEIAQGQGESIRNLADLMACKGLNAEARLVDIGRSVLLKSGQETVVGEAKVDAFMRQVVDDQSLIRSCTKVF